MSDILDNAQKKSGDTAVTPQANSALDTTPLNPLPDPPPVPPDVQPTPTLPETKQITHAGSSGLKRKKGMGILISVILLLLISLPIGVYYVSQQRSLNDVRNRAADLYPGAPSVPGPCVGGGYTCNDCGGHSVCNKNTSLTCDQFRTLNGCGSGNAPPFGNNLPGGVCGSVTCSSTTACDPGTMTCQPVTGTGNCSGNHGNCYVTSGIGVGSDGKVCSAGGHWTTCASGYECRSSDCVPSGGTPKPPKPPGPTNTPPPSTPTSTPVVSQCTAIKVFKNNVQLDAAGLAKLQPGDAVVITVAGANASKAHIRINGGTCSNSQDTNCTWIESTTKNSNGDYTFNYTIPSDITNFTIESEIFGTDGNWH